MVGSTLNVDCDNHGLTAEGCGSRQIKRLTFVLQRLMRDVLVQIRFGVATERSFNVTDRSRSMISLSCLLNIVNVYWKQ